MRLPGRVRRYVVGVMAGAVLCASMANTGRADQAWAAISDDPRVLAQALMDARGAGRFDSISSGVVSQIIAPVARGEWPADGCRLDTRVFQVMVHTLEAYGSMLISDLARSCPGVAQVPPCPTTYVSPHCADPVRAVDVVRVGGVLLRGGPESVPFLRFLDSIVPRGTQAGQAQCGSNVALSYITSRIQDFCNHIHLALPTSGALRIVADPPGPDESALSKIAIGTPDFNGDGFHDVFRITGAGVLLHYQGDGRGFWRAPGTTVGTGWDLFVRVVAPGDFTGDGRADLIGIARDGTMRLYPGDGAGRWQNEAGSRIGTGWDPFSFVFSPGDFTGDGHVDMIAVRSDGVMLLYSGNGAGGWLTGTGQVIGSGWNGFSKVFSPRDFSGDGKTDILGVDGTVLRLYTGNGAGSWVDGTGPVIGTSWDQFVTLTSPGDFTGDGKTDILGVSANGAMLMYRGNGASGWATGTGEVIGSGWWVN